MQFLKNMGWEWAWVLLKANKLIFLHKHKYLVGNLSVLVAHKAAFVECEIVIYKKIKIKKIKEWEIVILESMSSSYTTLLTLSIKYGIYISPNIYL